MIFSTNLHLGTAIIINTILKLGVAFRCLGFLTSHDALNSLNMKRLGSRTEADPKFRLIYFSGGRSEVFPVHCTKVVWILSSLFQYPT